MLKINLTPWHVQMPDVGYVFCALAARQAGQKKKEVLYRKKALEAASAISKNFENWLSEKMNELIEKELRTSL